AGRCRRKVSGAQHCPDVVLGRLVRAGRTQGAPQGSDASSEIRSRFAESLYPSVGVAGGPGPPYGLQRDAVRLLDAPAESAHRFHLTVGEILEGGRSWPGKLTKYYGMSRSTARALPAP